ncbi:hypothetical protein PHPALM_31156 [Phytophthora palmivora]|uniref:Uncharacterized protein n=1 Tax=Phytophthora palmivora TaxID=4796 RepID=A0A2P4X3B3_9STRA|nr:hypothetical protein PHPALM_31156 [Phytophthora palmivora]
MDPAKPFNPYSIETRDCCGMPWVNGFLSDNKIADCDFVLMMMNNLHAIYKDTPESLIGAVVYDKLLEKL